MSEAYQEVWLAKAKEYVTEKADYEGNGYDVFCECYGKSEWFEMMAGFSTLKAFLSYVDDIASIYSDRQHDAKNSEF